jgi:hypothetical protein
VLMPHYQKTGQKHSVKIANRSFDDVAEFKYFGKTLNRLKLHARRDQEQTTFGECLLLFRSEFCYSACFPG